jgi:hypothetical protein
MQGILPAPWLTRAGSGGGVLLKLSDLLRRLIGRASLTTEQRELLAQLERTAPAACEPLLRATSKRDLLEQRFDEAFMSGGQDLLQVAARLGLTATSTSLDAAMSDVDFPEEVGRVLGQAAAAQLREGIRLLEIALTEWLRVFARMSDEDRVQMHKELGAASYQPLAFVYDPQIPSSLRRLLLDVTEGNLALMCVLYCVTANRSPEPWLSLALVEVFVRGQKQLLRFIAALPGTSIGQDIVPASERVDLEAMERERVQADAMVSEWERRAIASGQDAYFPFGGYEDE